MTQISRGRGFPSQTPDQSVKNDLSVRPNVLPGVPANEKASYPKRRITRRTIDLSTARTNPVEFSVSGSFIWAANANASTDLAQITLDSLDNDPIPFLAGTVISGVPFGKIFIENAAIAGGFLDLVIMTDDPTQRILVDN